jgi:hypothetical protein
MSEDDRDSAEDDFGRRNGLCRRAGAFSTLVVQDITRPGVAEPIATVWVHFSGASKSGPVSVDKQVAPPLRRTGTIALEQLVSLKRSKTRTSCEVLDDFSTFYRAPDAMKG